MERLRVLIGCLVFLVVLTFALMQFVLGYEGIAYELGTVWAVAALAVALIFRLTLPISIGTYFGVVDVHGGPWWVGVLFAAPGLLVAAPVMATAVMTFVLNGVRQSSTSVREPLQEINPPRPSVTHSATTTTGTTTTSNRASEKIPLGAANSDPYQQSGKEVLSGNVDPAIWARSLVEGEGNESAVKAAYVKLRVAQLNAEAARVRDEYARVKSVEENRQAEVEAARAQTKEFERWAQTEATQKKAEAARPKAEAEVSSDAARAQTEKLKRWAEADAAWGKSEKEKRRAEVEAAAARAKVEEQKRRADIEALHAKVKAAGAKIVEENLRTKAKASRDNGDV